MPSTPLSLPYPDCLKPPNGVWGLVCKKKTRQLAFFDQHFTKRDGTKLTLNALLIPTVPASI